MAPVTQGNRANCRAQVSRRVAAHDVRQGERVLSQLGLKDYRFTFRASIEPARDERTGLAAEVSRDSREGPEG